MFPSLIEQESQNLPYKSKCSKRDSSPVKMVKVQCTAKKSRVQAKEVKEARKAVEENKKAQLERDKQLSDQQKQAALTKEYKAQVKQLIEMNKIDVVKGDISFNFR